MKVSIITVCYNSEEFIEECIKSVITQSYKNIEYIIIDGNSKDSTMEIVRKYKDIISIIVSEKDNGLYDAMNKGIRLATGDIVGILNSDDLFASEESVKYIVDEFSEDVDCVFANLYFFKNNLENKTRYYNSEKFKLNDFLRGDAPAHPTFYARRELFDNYGYYSTEYKICSDFELMLNFLYIKKLKYKFINKTIVYMREGGASTKNLYQYVRNNQEKHQILNASKIRTSYFKLYSRYYYKIFQYIVKSGGNNWKSLSYL